MFLAKDVRRLRPYQPCGNDGKRKYLQWFGIRRWNPEIGGRLIGEPVRSHRVCLLQAKAADHENKPIQWWAMSIPLALPAWPNVVKRLLASTNPSAPHRQGPRDPNAQLIPLPLYDNTRDGYSNV